MFARFLLTVLLLLVPVSVLASSVAAQGSETVFDEADVLSAAEEQDVRAAFEQVSEESGEQLYAFLVSDTNVDVADRPEFLEDKAREAGAPPDADVIVVDTEDRWGLVDVAGGSDQEVYNAMAPHFQDGEFARGLVAGGRHSGGRLPPSPPAASTTRRPPRVGGARRGSPVD